MQNISSKSTFLGILVSSLKWEFMMTSKRSGFLPERRFKKPGQRNSGFVSKNNEKQNKTSFTRYSQKMQVIRPTVSDLENLSATGHLSSLKISLEQVG